MEVALLLLVVFGLLAFGVVGLVLLVAVGGVGWMFLSGKQDALDDDEVDDDDFQSFVVQRKFPWELAMTEAAEEHLIEALEAYDEQVDSVSVNKADAMVRVGSRITRVDWLAEAFARTSGGIVGVEAACTEVFCRPNGSLAFVEDWLADTSFAGGDPDDVMDELRKAVELRASDIGEKAALDAALDEMHRSGDEARALAAASRKRFAMGVSDPQPGLLYLAAVAPANLSMTDETEGFVSFSVKVECTERINALHLEEDFHGAVEHERMHQNVLVFSLAQALPHAQPGREARDSLRTALGRCLADGQAMWKRDPTPVELSAVQQLLSG